MGDPEFGDISETIHRLPKTVLFSVDADILVNLKKRRSYPPSLDNWFWNADSVPTGGFRAHFFRVGAGFAQSGLERALSTCGLTLGRVEHLIKLGMDGHLGSELGDVAALGSPYGIDFDTDFRGNVYPLRYRDGTWGTLEVNRKEYNKYDYHWIEQEVTVLAIEPYEVARTVGLWRSENVAPPTRLKGPRAGVWRRGLPLLALAIVFALVAPRAFERVNKYRAFREAPAKRVASSAVGARIDAVRAEQMLTARYAAVPFPPAALREEYAYDTLGFVEWPMTTFASENRLRQARATQFLTDLRRAHATLGAKYRVSRLRLVKWFPGDGNRKKGLFTLPEVPVLFLLSVPLGQYPNPNFDDEHDDDSIHFTVAYRIDSIDESEVLPIPRVMGTALQVEYTPMTE